MPEYQEDADTLEDLRDVFEWHCNETNNYHCRVVTELRDIPGVGAALIVQPRTDETGEPVKISGWDSVIRRAVRAAMEDDGLVFSASPGKLTLINAERRR